MPRPFVPGQRQADRLAPAVPARKVATSNGSRISTRKRSQRYLEALTRLDVTAHSAHVDLDVLHHEIELEFRPVIDSMPIGWVSRCYLGHPYEVHHLDMFGDIVDHCRVGEVLPAKLERARRLSLHPSYILIEVYETSMVCVRSDGSAVEVEE